jgi:hypothetical protein
VNRRHQGTISSHAYFSFTCLANGTWSSLAKSTFTHADPRISLTTSLTAPHFSDALFNGFQLVRTLFLPVPLLCLLSLFYHQQWLQSTRNRARLCFSLVKALTLSSSVKVGRGMSTRWSLLPPLSTLPYSVLVNSRYEASFEVPRGLQ